MPEKSAVLIVWSDVSFCTYSQISPRSKSFHRLLGGKKCDLNYAHFNLVYRFVALLCTSRTWTDEIDFGVAISWNVGKA